MNLIAAVQSLKRFELRIDFVRNFYDKNIIKTIHRA